MTRKRFTNILMALGVSRNTAAACAAHVRVQYGDYETGLCEITEILCKTLANLVPEILDRIEMSCPDFSIERQPLSAPVGYSPLLNLYGLQIVQHPAGVCIITNTGGGQQ